MIKIKSNQEIGYYIENLILSKFDSKRSFYKEYVKLKENINEANVEFEDYLKNTTNRFNQIIHGYKAIQMTDLPYISHIFHVDFEDILSAGTAKITNNAEKQNSKQQEDENIYICYACGNTLVHSNDYCDLCGCPSPSAKKHYLKNNNVLPTDEEADEIKDKIEDIYSEDILKYLMYQFEKAIKKENYFELAEFYSKSWSYFMI